MRSVFDLEGKELDLFLEKYGDIFEPRYVDLDYYKLYYLGKYDHLIHMFYYISQTYNIKKVLYPGSFIHLSPSYAFSDVTYVDIYDNIESFFISDEVKKYVSLHKLYEDECCYKFVHQSYSLFEGKYDLLISSNAGSVSIDCKKNLAHNGYLLVNNGHSDADNAFSDADYKYLGYFKFNTKKDHVTFIIDNTSNVSNTYYMFQFIGDN